VTPAGTLKSSTMADAAVPLWSAVSVEVARTPTPWLAKARQMMA
jgi:hypothetical protein